MNDDKKQDYANFVKEAELLDMAKADDPLTTWENNLTDRMVSPIVLTRYFKFLRTTNIILFSLLIVLLVVVLALSVRFLFFHSYEKIIFSDGTDMSCLYDPKTGEMKQNDQK